MNNNITLIFNKLNINKCCNYEKFINKQNNKNIDNNKLYLMIRIRSRKARNNFIQCLMFNNRIKDLLFYEELYLIDQIIKNNYSDSVNWNKLIRLLSTEIIMILLDIN